MARNNFWTTPKMPSSPNKGEITSLGKAQGWRRNCSIHICGFSIYLQTVEFNLLFSHIMRHNFCFTSALGYHISVCSNNKVILEGLIWTVWNLHHRSCISGSGAISNGLWHQLKIRYKGLRKNVIILKVSWSSLAVVPQRMNSRTCLH